MNLKNSTVAGICFFLAGLLFFLPIALFDIEYEGIDNDRMEWSCDSPIRNPNPGDVDLDDVRSQLGEIASDAPEDVKVESKHPECRKLARAQLIMGVIAVLAGIWKTRHWWSEGQGARAEKKFKKLHQSAGKPRGMLG